MQRGIFIPRPQSPNKSRHLCAKAPQRCTAPAVPTAPPLVTAPDPVAVPTHLSQHHHPQNKTMCGLEVRKQRAPVAKPLLHGDPSATPHLPLPQSISSFSRCPAHARLLRKEHLSLLPEYRAEFLQCSCEGAPNERSRGRRARKQHHQSLRDF
jgi:hypothetical protein